MNLIDQIDHKSIYENNKKSKPIKACFKRCIHLTVSSDDHPVTNSISSFIANKESMINCFFSSVNRNDGVLTLTE